MSAAQRASLEAVEAADRGAAGGARGSIAGLGGILGGGNSGGLGDGGQQVGGRERAGSGVWDAVKGFASAAGQRAAELEEVAWRKVNGK